MPRRLEKPGGVRSVSSGPTPGGKVAAVSSGRMQETPVRSMAGQVRACVIVTAQLNHTDLLDRIGFGALCPGKSGDLLDTVWPMVVNQARAKKPDIPDVNMDIEAVLEAMRPPFDNARGLVAAMSVNPGAKAAHRGPEEQADHDHSLNHTVQARSRSVGISCDRKVSNSLFIMFEALRGSCVFLP